VVSGEENAGSQSDSASGATNVRTRTVGDAVGAQATRINSIITSKDQSFLLFVARTSFRTHREVGEQYAREPSAPRAG